MKIKRKIAGESEGAQLVDFLNHPRSEPKKIAATVEVLRLMQELLRLKQSARDMGIRNLSPRGPVKESRIYESIQRIRGELNQKLERCVVFPLLWDERDLESEMWEFSFATPKWFEGENVADGVWELVLLAEKGLLERLRNCAQCSKWIFVRVPKGDRSQKYCNECSRNHRSQNDEYKRVQASYQKHKRKYYNFDGTDFHKNKVCRKYLRTGKCEICKEFERTSGVRNSKRQRGLSSQ